MIHGITLERDHDAHVDEESEDFRDCYQAVVHCESEAEAQRIARLVSNRDAVQAALADLDGAVTMLEDDDIVDIDMVVAEARRSLRTAVSPGGDAA